MSLSPILDAGLVTGLNMVHRDWQANGAMVWPRECGLHFCVDFGMTSRKGMRSCNYNHYGYDRVQISSQQLVHEWEHYLPCTVDSELLPSLEHSLSPERTPKAQAKLFIHTPCLQPCYRH